MRRAIVLLALVALHCSPAEKAADPLRQPTVKKQPSAPATAQALVEVAPPPLAAGAAEPFLSSARDSILMSWIEPVAGTRRAAVRVARHRNGAWSQPATVVEREDLFVNWADFPSVVEDEEGTLFVHWLQKSAGGTYTYDVVMATSTDDGRSWSRPFLLNRDGVKAEHGFVSLVALPGAGVGAAWLDGRKMGGGDHHGGHGAGDMTLRYGKVDRNGALSDEVELDARTCECCTTGMARTAAGAVLVYRDRSPEEIRDISRVVLRNGSWSAPQRVRADDWKIAACPVNGPQIDAIGNDAVTAWFTAAGETPRVFASFSRDGGETFGNALQIDDGKPVGRVDAVLIDPTTAVVVWMEQAAGGTEIRAKTLSAAPGPSITIAQSSSARGSGFPRIAKVGREVYFAWTEQKGSERTVRMAKRGF